MRPRLLDLHVHSVRSDGLYTPLQLQELARRTGLAAIALTDHDLLPSENGPEGTPYLLAGVELSTERAGKGIHLLGYGFDPKADRLRAICRRVQDSRRERLQRMLSELEQLGARLDRDRVARLREHPAPGRMHLARELVRRKLSPTVRGAFQRWLSRLEGTDFERPETVEAIEAIHEAGGIAILAHPSPLWTSHLIPELVAAGLDGIETYFPGASRRGRILLTEFAQSQGLLVSAGSDFHGDEYRSFLGQCTLDTNVRWTERLLPAVAVG